uniref:Alcohol dehydrogenase-like C-terminal domain-containing protein n=1 Tax=Globisporangium ultimum (strain ATCC 200006 / CBS 805.95 / DAOM BR144) TaxID=431595 RepID=K3WNB1_GLOUD
MLRHEASNGLNKLGSIADNKEILKVATERNVRPIIEKLSMSRVNKGFQKMCDGKARYRVVLKN